MPPAGRTEGLQWLSLPPSYSMKHTTQGRRETASRVLNLIDQAAEHRPHLVVLPECIRVLLGT